MSTLRFEVEMRTDKGLVRENNEDTVGGDPTTGLLILADGMGGANAGEVASSLAVNLLVNQLVLERESDIATVNREDLHNALDGVNTAILDLAQQVPDYQGMGTTLVMGLFHQDRLLYAHVGDSRLYLMRDNKLTLLTSDHTLIQELVGLGEFDSVDEALEAGVPQNILSRAYGAEPIVEPDIAEIELQAGDVLLLCSDGLTNMVSEAEMKGVLQNDGADLMSQVNSLIDLANDNGGTDNISVILARVVEKEQLN